MLIKDEAQGRFLMKCLDVIPVDAFHASAEESVVRGEESAYALLATLVGRALSLSGA